ncbi:hypothetical protein ZIOFF_057409 [Zingiber officinale]|uniref:4-coumarate--CoA ligase n=1 Tax=Zingiber officinale TaxID=94328 RepID=A0A8J5F2M9_ZINOF|nr:hypothetical protein ZIOFF_057409 [Zingiber officinale]
MGGEVGGWTIIVPASLGCLLSLASDRVSRLPFRRVVSLALRPRIASPWLARSRLFSVQTTRSSSTLMEAVKAILAHVSTTEERVAIRAEQKNYTHVQLIDSALNISDLLLGAGTINAKEECAKSIGFVNGPRDLNGGRVGIVAKPSAEFVAAIFGTWLSGGVAVPLALSYPESELLHVMNDSDISMILSTQDHQGIMENVAAKCSAKLSLLPTLASMSSRDILNKYSGETAANLVADLIRKIEDSSLLKGDDPALILYTSGTTGKPKGVAHTHNNIISQVEFMPKFSVRGVWQRWCDSYPKDGNTAEDAITVFTGVPTMYTRLLQGYKTMDPNQQEAVASAAKQLRLMFVMALSNPLHGARKAGTVGKPLPRVEVKILAEDGRPVGAKGVGELCVRSPSMFKEYWKKPEATKDSFIDDGFFKTGDTVRVDEDGYYIILGRTNADIMKVGGYKLSALEIEAVLLEASKSYIS